MIKENLSTILGQLPANCRLIVVSKFRSHAEIMEAYASGHRAFGENRVQDLVEKQKQLPADIEWHLIGHLQSNKVKYIAPFVALIHSVDSLKLAEEIDKQAAANKRTIRCLLQVHIAKEESKFGFSPDELILELKNSQWKNLQHIQICGLMGMATLTNDQGQIRNEFKTLKTLFEVLKKTVFSGIPTFTELSMGMSGDYKIAVEEGSTMVRVGSKVFGG
jgi:pyridoxal phosphate enzyme (YggS family)